MTEPDLPIEWLPPGDGPASTPTDPANGLSSDPIVDGPVDGLPSYAPPPPPPPTTRRTPARLLAVGIATVALLAGSAFAIYALTRPDGTESPDAAVHQLFGAIDHEDAIGVIESLPPGERKVLHDPLVDATQQLQRLGVLKSFSLSNVPGADIKVKGLKTTSTTIGDGVALVSVDGGTISGASIPDDIPLGDALRKSIEDNGGTVDLKAETFSEDLSNDHIHLVAIREDGGWHVSLAYSIAEAIRTNITDDHGHQPPVPEFGTGPTPVGADDPEGAVKGLVDAAVSLDAEKAIVMTDPEEMRALYDYAPLFLPNINRSVRDHRSAGDVVKVDKLTTNVTGDGDVRRVSITGFDATIGGPDNRTHIAYDGTCYDVTSTYTSTFYAVGQAVYPAGIYPDPSVPAPSSAPQKESQTSTSHTCPGDPSQSTSSFTDSTGTHDMSTESSDLIAGFGGLGAGSKQAFAVTVTQIDGRWYVSPVRTILDSLVDGLKAMQPSDIKHWGGLFGSTSQASSSSSDYGTGSGTFGTVGPAVPDSGGTTATTIDGSSMAGMLFSGVSPASRAAIGLACSAQLDTYFGTSFGDMSNQPSQMTELANLRALYGCAAGVVPGYQPCVTHLDAAIEAEKSGGNSEPEAIAAQTCAMSVTN